MVWLVRNQPSNWISNETLARGNLLISEYCNQEGVIFLLPRVKIQSLYQKEIVDNP